MNDARALTQQLRLTPREAAFVVAYVDAGGGGSAAQIAAMVAAGYSESTARADFKSVTRRPEVVAAIHLETARRLQESAPGALATVRGIADGIITDNAKTRLDAAKTLLDRAGHIAPRARAAGDGQEKTLSEMSLEDLKRLQDQLQGELASRAKPVNAPIEAVPSSEAVDLIG